MKTAITLLKNLILPRLEKDANFKQQPGDIFWPKFTADFLFYKKDPKPVFAAIYSLELEDPESIINKLPSIHSSLTEELAEQYVLGIRSEAVKRLRQNGNAAFEEHVAFFSELKNVSTYLERRRMIEEMPTTYAAISEEIPDDAIQAVIKKKGREELKNRFKIWDEEMNKEKIDMTSVEISSSMPPPKERTERKTKGLSKSTTSKDNNFSYKWLYAVAAVLLIGFFVWQPTQKSNEELFNSYAGNVRYLSNMDFSELGETEDAVVTRGGEFRFSGLTQNESESALEAINCIQRQEFHNAKNILEKLNPAGRSAELLFLLAFAQLNTGEIDRAVEKLEILSQTTSYTFQEEAQFHLALGYLAQGDNASARKVLRKLEEDQGKYAVEASAILEDMKWF